ncbi:MAG: hypothetical protein KKC69_04805 [Acidobacteria bacterium]|nr:hypothetical protein [Acidobacteriota bacterium]MBU2438456.1 hypothetical protein [Acidobacteriota bacterium]
MADKRNRDNPTNRLNTVLDVIETAGRLRSSTVIVAGGDRIDDVELVESARDHGFVDRIILVGDKKRIHQIIGDLGIEIPEKDILQADGNEEIAARTVRTALEEDIDILLKGRVTTGTLSRDMLKLANRPTTSLVTLLDSSAIGRGRPILMSDPAITTIANYGRLTGIIRNAVDVAQTVLEIEKPRVAVLSAYERVIASLPSTQTALALSSLDWQDAYVCGPLSFDLATSAEVLEIKGKPDLLNAGEVAGRADVLICPNIETANVLYKAISAQARFGNASMANIAVGFDVSYGIISRADSLETRLTSIALCSVFAQRTREKPHTHRKSVVVSEKTSTVLAVDPELEHLQVAVYKGGRRIREDTLPVTELTDGIHVDWDRQIHAWTRTLKERLGRAGIRPESAAEGGGIVFKGRRRLPGRVYRITDGTRTAPGKKPSAPSDHFELVEAGGALHLGIPLVRCLAEEWNIPGYAVQPMELTQREWDRLRKGDHELLFREWLIPAAFEDTAERFGVPEKSLSLILVHGAEDISVVGVDGHRMDDCRITVLDMDSVQKMDLQKEEAVEVAAPILEEIRKAAAFRKNFIHAVIFTGILAHRSALSRSLKGAVQELAPVLTFTGKPDVRTVAIAAQKAVAHEKLKPISGGKR